MRYKSKIILLLKPFFLFFINSFLDWNVYYIYAKPLQQIKQQTFKPQLQTEKLTLYIIKSTRKIKKLVQNGYEFTTYPQFTSLKKWINNENIAFCLFQQKKLVHISMLALDSKKALFDQIFSKIQFEANVGFIGASFTSPIFRGMGIYPYTLEQICSFLKNKGKSKALINSKKKNQASQRGIEKAGFIILKKIVYIKFIIWKFYIKRYAKN